MVQTIKAYKCMKTTLKAYKSNMGTKLQKLHKHGYKKNQTQYTEKHLKYININQSITAKQIHEF